MIHRLRDELRKLFFLTRSEANGYLVLLILMGLFLIAPIFFDIFTDEQPFQSKAEQQHVDSLIVAWEANLAPPSKNKEETPSQLPEYKKEQDSKSKSPFSASQQHTTSKKPSLQPFNINTADTATLKKIYGIGPVLSVRIVKFRDKLGGFYALHQLYDVYGLDSATTEKLIKYCFIEDSFQVTKIPLNSADFKMINAHPYISYEQTKNIVNYRRKHGAFNLVKDIINNKLVDSTTYSKCKLYLTL